MSDATPAYVHRLTVRFSDCDLLGHVNNAVYFTYCEEARLAWWRYLTGDLGFPDSGSVIAHAECDYRAPAFVAEELDVRVFLGGIGRSSVTMRYEIVNVATGQLVAEGKSVSVTVAADKRTTIPVPESARTMLTANRPAGNGNLSRS